MKQLFPLTKQRLYGMMATFIRQHLTNQTILKILDLCKGGLYSACFCRTSLPTFPPGRELKAQGKWSGLHALLHMLYSLFFWRKDLLSKEVVKA